MVSAERGGPPADNTWWRRWWDHRVTPMWFKHVVVVVTAVLAVLWISGTGKLLDSSGAQDGAVRFNQDPTATQTAGVRARAGQRVVFGANTITNNGDTAARLRGAELSGDVPETSATVSEVRAIVLDSHHEELVGAAVWPFEDYRAKSLPAEGLRIAPGQEVELLYIVDVRVSGEWYWPTTTVTYEVDGEVATASTNFGFLVCPARAAECRPPSG